MNIETMKRVLVIDDDASHSKMLAGYLASRRYDVQTCDCIEHEDVLVDWRPQVLVLVPAASHRHQDLQAVRRKHPRLPVVVFTPELGPDLLLDVEAFAPALPVAASSDFAGLARTVAAALS